MKEVRKTYSLSVPVKVMDKFDELSKELGMTRSRFFEFMTLNMMRADKMPFGDFIEQLLKEVVKKKR